MCDWRVMQGKSSNRIPRSFSFMGVFNVGEVKGSDINTLLMNMNTGHKCMTTFHAIDKPVSILKELFSCS